MPTDENIMICINKINELVQAVKQLNKKFEDK